MQILTQIVGGGALQRRDGGRQRHVESGQHERQRLTHVPDDQLKLQKPAEHTAQNQPYDVGRGFDVPAARVTCATWLESG